MSTLPVPTLSPDIQRQIADLRATRPYDGRRVTLCERRGGWRWQGLTGTCTHLAADHCHMVLRVERDPENYWPIGMEILAELDDESVPQFHVWNCIDDEPNAPHRILLNHNGDWTGDVRITWYLAGERTSMCVCWCDGKDLVAGLFTPVRVAMHSKQVGDVVAAEPPLNVVTRAVALAVEAHASSKRIQLSDEGFETSMRRNRDLGYGRMMQIISELWRADDPIGALSVGDTYGMIERKRQRCAAEGHDVRHGNSYDWCDRCGACLDPDHGEEA